MAESVRVPGGMVSLDPPASSSDDEGTSRPRAVVLAEASAGSSCSARKPRGRPPGSKNKPKPPVAVTRACASAMHPVLLQFYGGFDIVSGLSDFVRRHRVGVSVLGATGVVSVVSLRLASFAHGVQGITIQGPFDILSLSGTLLPPSDPALPPGAPPPLTVSLASSHGQVIGGALAGSMPASGPVLLIAATLSRPEFHRLPISDDDDDDEPTVEGVDSILK